ncbi:tryptophan synthase subunit alpha [Micromonospora radicis]|uniref:Tryptophan synthase alpha chain n=1 Tax=Micromonospora radicis TaxID=1894971 RepID=A0A418MZE7_9ACTN|nr:tryptophan synthase subunit alpha [Micromonospora radicis]
MRRRRDAGRSLLVPYVTAGISADWTDYLHAYADAGADAIEVGLPFSDPMLDGATIQEASHRALSSGTTTAGVLARLAGTPVAVPLAVMTYANIVFRHGAATFCDRLAQAGVAGLIVPDVPYDEVDELSTVATAAGVELVLLASPVTAPTRLRRIAERSRGFVYGVTVMGTTGERTGLSDSARALGTTLRGHGSRPVLLGFGISSPGQAALAAGSADGVVVASSLMREVLAGRGPREVAGTVAALRAGLDAG